MPEIELFPRSPAGVRGRQAARLLTQSTARKALDDVRARKEALPVGATIGAELVPLVLASRQGRVEHIFIGLRYPVPEEVKTALSKVGTIDFDSGRRTPTAASNYSDADLQLANELLDELREHLTPEELEQGL